MDRLSLTKGPRGSCKLCRTYIRNPTSPAKFPQSLTVILAGLNRGGQQLEDPGHPKVLLSSIPSHCTPPS
ncbi:hypothetical protein LSAT2_008950 [Lamellibrachia satsuma]|nr:hypothetical protein LSAT2_008950 [Lamellibrachia satsuma]